MILGASTFHGPCKSGYTYLLGLWGVLLGEWKVKFERIKLGTSSVGLIPLAP